MNHVEDCFTDPIYLTLFESALSIGVILPKRPEVCHLTYFVNVSDQDIINSLRSTCTCLQSAIDTRTSPGKPSWRRKN